MPDNKTKPTKIDVGTFLLTIDEKRRAETQVLIDLMRNVSDNPPVMWGPSIIGFGSQHYKYDSGREGDTPRIGFSPRKSAITIYFNEGFDRHSTVLAKLGKYKQSVSCLYINKLEDINLVVLQRMIEHSFRLGLNLIDKPTTVDEYVVRVPAAARSKFNELRSIVKAELPDANEVLSYGIVGYKIDDKRARAFVSGWKDHVAIYPVPKDAALQTELAPYIKGKGTLWFSLDKPLPKSLIQKAVKILVK